MTVIFSEYGANYCYIHVMNENVFIIIFTVHKIYWCYCRPVDKTIICTLTSVVLQL